MSIILKGIDLPKEGELTFIAVCNDGRAYKMAMPPTGVLRLGSYANLYQAIQIPEGHGRLIDVDKIDYDEFWHREGQGFTIAVCQKAQQIIEEQPTILEAEEE
jgi:hypothetical protein